MLYIKNKAASYPRYKQLLFKDYDTLTQSDSTKNFLCATQTKHQSTEELHNIT